ncbi:Ltp family lipoprotein [Cellulomonas bogoriensis]|uniref:Putative host cell surface-exposed lipoprotein Ltp-like HTH region domain-containing protein n=1 Tax=Cellulomonas bogoriensis 69B4 = DSM 16987 TaxID=1386082 RepID=A0A0A0C4X7_9CELL|nr:Ltp family lipoprotein [Cellulomonas bogoriensis]KGM14419.1 hypothetical protein N869_10985 [Cellulomonas bogoriensis 69B4 = DSM 16987]
MSDSHSHQQGLPAGQHPPQEPHPGQHPPQQPTPSGQTARPWFRKKRVIIPAGVLAFFIMVGALSGGADDGPEPVATATPTVEATPTDEPSPADEPEAPAEEPEAVEEEPDADAAAEEEAPAGTVSQQNAYRSAQSYLSFTAFSRTGLIQQLSSDYGEGYPLEDAEFAVARLEAEGEVDWLEQAVKSAENYLSFTSFSRSGLIEQLSSQHGEGFTREQAEHAADEVGL